MALQAIILLLYIILIFTGVEDNFEKLTSNLITTQGIPYDYGSVMHYNAYAFSRNGNPTIEPLQNGVSLNDLGQRNGFSESDRQHVLSLYCNDGGMLIMSNK